MRIRGSKSCYSSVFFVFFFVFFCFAFICRSTNIVLLFIASEGFCLAPDNNPDIKIGVAVSTAEAVGVAVIIVVVVVVVVVVAAAAAAAAAVAAAAATAAVVVSAAAAVSSAQHIGQWQELWAH